MWIITGMHRSGTSLVARLFHRIGADMGNPEGFIAPNRWNSDGYYEQREIMDLNKKLVNGPLGKLSYLWLPSAERVIKRGREHAQEIGELSRRYEGKFIKDPRFCLTLPAWTKHACEINGIIMCVREPLEVARSLKIRDLSPMRFGLRQWWIHNARLLEGLTGIDYHVVSYNRLVGSESALDEMGAAFQFCGLPSERARLVALRDECIRMQPQAQAVNAASYPRNVRALWQKLSGLHRKATAATNPSPAERRSG